ncbi:MAG: IMP cyclohydrolase, partial [Oscillospiraceae bacterium]|nr:IMP cyclohydrolase [Oscillospiraceae bacterium]
SAVTMPNGSYMISILKALEGNPNVCERYFYEYSKSTPGLGHFISTYKTDGDPLPSFEGEPIPISIDNVEDLNDFAQNIWNSLNSENKVSLYIREQYIKTNDVKEIIINVNER